MEKKAANAKKIAKKRALKKEKGLVSFTKTGHAEIGKTFYHFTLTGSVEEATVLRKILYLDSNSKIQAKLSLLGTDFMDFDEFHSLYRPSIESAFDLFRALTEKTTERARKIMETLKGEKK